MSELNLLHSPDAEKGLIGAVIIDPNAYKSLNVQPEDFYLIQHKVLWSAIGELHSAGTAVDLLTITDNLTRTERLSTVGGQGYIVGLVNATPTSVNAEHYADIVRNMSKRRKVVLIAQNVATRAYDRDSNLDEAVAKAAADLVMNAAPTGGAVHIGQYLDRLYDAVQSRHQNPTEFFGIQTGLIDFDKITSGLQQGEMMILSGEPGLGKSLLAFQMCAGMSKHAPGAVYEMEMSGMTVLRRQASSMSGVNTYKLRSGRYPDDEFQAFSDAVEAMSLLPIYLSDTSHWTTTSMKADLVRLKEIYKIRWFIVDYLDLFADTYGKDGNERSAWISKQVHSICKDLDLAGLIIHSMNKKGMGSSPSKENLSGSGRLMYDADQIVFMTKSETQPNVINLTWDKMRESDTGINGMKLVKKQGFPCFENYVSENKYKPAYEPSLPYKD